MDPTTANLQSALHWLRSIVAGGLGLHFGTLATFEASPLSFYGGDSWLTQFVAQNKPTYDEMLLFVVALAPHLEPGFYNKLLADHLPEGGDFAEFGGVKEAGYRNLLPTGETAQFVLAGNNLSLRLGVQRLLSSDHWLARQHTLWLGPVREGEPRMSGRLMLSDEVMEQLTTGTVSKPRFSADFPAELLETELGWHDLVLHPSTLLQIRELESWITHSATLLGEWGMQKRLKPGYRALFYGPPGTGKTLTATLLGKHTGKDVFRVDLSRVVSKYIGETEKNLARLFDKAENKNWILFFDEADALFSKRTDIRDAHDKYANQEVAYLLQRIEGYQGLVILATNQRRNIDDAFIRRFQSIIHFPMPRAEERLVIWQQAFPPQIELAADIDWPLVAARYELTGAGILNVAHYCAIELLAARSHCLDFKRLESGILREYTKEGRVV